MNEELLLLSIAHCPIAKSILKNEKGFENHPCRKIVESQKSSFKKFRVPEPWSGHLCEAPILFIGSNPSISFPSEKEDPLDVEVFPKFEWPDDKIVDFFMNRFNGSCKKWVVDGRKNLRENGSYRKRAVPFWSSVINRTATLLEKSPKEVDPGKDYAITELVHCKSKHAKGFKEALETCTIRYLDKLFELSTAKVIVSPGKKVENFLREKYNLDKGKIEYVNISGAKRAFIFPDRTQGGIQILDNYFRSEYLMKEIQRTAQNP